MLPSATEVGQERSNHVGLCLDGSRDTFTRRETAQILHCSLSHLDNLRKDGALIPHPRLRGIYTLTAIRQFLDRPFAVAHGSQRSRRVA